MTTEEAIAKLVALQDHGDRESAHMDADEILLELIGDPRVKEAFDDIDKWYA